MSRVYLFWKTFRHILHGCVEFNRRWPHWERAPGEQYPRCSLCGGKAYWMWGYRHYAPDLVAQAVQRTTPSPSDRYYAEKDGWR